MAAEDGFQEMNHQLKLFLKLNLSFGHEQNQRHYQHSQKFLQMVIVVLPQKNCPFPYECF